MPSPEARSLLRGHFKGFAGGIIDNNLSWGSVFNNFHTVTIFAVGGFTFDRNSLCRRQFFRLCIDKLLDLFRLAEQFLVDLREALLILFELRLVGAFIVERGVQAGQRCLVSLNGGFRFEDLRSAGRRRGAGRK